MSLNGIPIPTHISEREHLLKKNIFKWLFRDYFINVKIKKIRVELTFK